MNYDILRGDCLETMRSLPSGIVQTCVTSPPYYGLRDYGTASWEGGDPECDHKQMRSIGSSTLRNDGRRNIGTQAYEKTAAIEVPYRDTCRKCGARRVDNQIGLESSPEAYVAKLVEVFREVRRVMRDDATLWLNLGDSYNGSGGAGGDYGAGGLKEGQPKYPGRNVNGLGPKQLLGIPWRVAFALQADGWILRSEIIWHKKACMPESVTDRPTKSHEQVFLLAKSRDYYYDHIAIAEPLETPIHKPGNNFHPDQVSGPNDRGGHSQWEDTKDRAWGNPAGRNKRSVWTLGPESYSGAHFATMPTKLIEPCILAGTSARGCCAKCGAPWVRVVERIDDDRPTYKTEGAGEWANGSGRNDGKGLRKVLRADGRGGDLATKTNITTGWQPTCTCNADVVPCVVLDPFAGAGTTLLVANRYGRRAIGCELNPEYIKLATERLDRNQPMLAGLTL